MHQPHHHHPHAAREQHQQGDYDNRLANGRSPDYNDGAQQGYYIPNQPEQDSNGDGSLPTYGDLTEQHEHIPNSRFGRWRSWIEKRAAERYSDTTRDDYERRRARGWDLSGIEETPVIVNEPASPLTGPSERGPLRLLTTFTAATDAREGDGDRTPRSSAFTPSPLGPPGLAVDPAPKGLVAEHIEPSHLRLNHFGSRFIPHTDAPIRCMLPLPSEDLILLGHDDGLSVLNMFPSEWNEHGLVNKGPGDAVAKVIWEGEGVYQLSLLELEGVTDDTPQGVVLALVGPEAGSPKEADSSRQIRMYNLASLFSLAKWAISGRGTRPLDLRRPSNWQPQETPAKKHSRHSSIARNLKNLILESPIAEKASRSFPSAHSLRPTSPVNSPAKSPLAGNHRDLPHSRPVVARGDSSSSSDSASWDVVDDLPLRWATDFVSLATPGSRLTNVSVLSYDLYLSNDSRSRGGAMLAIATKGNILLYETPRGERAFHFVKEFYTPLSPRKVSFVHQAVPGTAVTRMTSYTPATFGPGRPHSRAFSEESSYSPQLSLFVVFDKKAGLIRLADSAVGEIELYSGSDDACSVSSSKSDAAGRLAASASSHSLPSRGHKTRSSFDSTRTHAKSGHWLLPSECELPSPDSLSPTHALPTMRAYVLTRGRQTHLVPGPLPANLAATPPMYVFMWNTPPSHVSPRLCRLPADKGGSPFLQLVAFSEEGLEVQEISVAALFPSFSSGATKGKGRAEEPVHADFDVGGSVNFLMAGGQWQRPGAELGRNMSVMSAMSSTSFDTLDTEQMSMRMRVEQGVYASVCKGPDDWRVFWVGGTGQEAPSRGGFD